MNTENSSKYYKILVADDETDITDAIAYALKREFYEVAVAYDGKEALEKIAIFRPDVIILDVMMPHYDGYEVCKNIGKENKMGILMLTAKTGLIDKVLGLELGADDYLTKPFEMLELLARVKSLCRRINRLGIESENLNDIRFEELKIDLRERVVYVGDTLIELKPKEFELLAFLFKNPKQVFSRNQILERVWDMDYVGGTRTIDIHIQRIRKKLGKYGDLIKTVSKIGYKAVTGFDEA